LTSTALTGNLPICPRELANYDKFAKNVINENRQENLSYNHFGMVAQTI
jgi:hypothetical protein